MDDNVSVKDTTRATRTFLLGFQGLQAAAANRGEASVWNYENLQTPGISLEPIRCFRVIIEIIPPFSTGSYGDSAVHYRSATPPGTGS